PPPPPLPATSPHSRHIGAWCSVACSSGPEPLAAGAWGVGTHIARTARWVAGAGYEPVVLCGRNAELRRDVERVPGARAVGWTDDMPGLLAGAHALVDNAAGQTALEALAAGVPVVGYRPIPGHGREGVKRMAREGFTDYARDSWALVRSLDALTAPGPVRARRTAAGRSLFAADPVAPLEELAARHGAAGACPVR
ncbi:galactosyldiacylglycerol synthase, partial [Streptomyces bomunensis]|nr:galactosyldiacylglycerol synthase [Streptomyces montanisoli]